jgi:hypothetical protein
MVTCLAYFLITAASLFLVNESRIGGPAYTTITNSRNALESIALSTSSLHQMLAEMQNLLTEADRGSSAKSTAIIKTVSNDIDQQLARTMELVEQPSERDQINKADSVWKEYRKTLLEDIRAVVVLVDGVNRLRSQSQTREARPSWPERRTENGELRTENEYMPPVAWALRSPFSVLRW